MDNEHRRAAGGEATAEDTEQAPPPTERHPAEVTILVASALVPALLVGIGVFVWLTRLHQPFGSAPGIMALACVMAMAGMACWAETTRRGQQTHRAVVVTTLVACAVGVPLGFGVTRGVDVAAGRLTTVVAGLLLVASLPIVMGLTSMRDRQVGAATTPPIAVAGGALLGGLMALTVAVIEAPDLPDATMREPGALAWEQLTSADAVQVQSQQRSGGDTAPAATTSLLGNLDLTDHRARIRLSNATSPETDEIVEWDPDAPWTAPDPVERLWRAAVGVAEWEETASGFVGQVDPRRLTAARVEAMPNLRSRLGARWHLGDATVSGSMSVLLRVEDDGFPTRLGTRERSDDTDIERAVTTLYRR